MPYSSIIKEITENIAMGDLDDALGQIKVVESWAQNNETLLHALYYKSKIDLINSNFNMALNRAEKCVQLSKELNLDTLTAKALALEAFASMSLGKLDEAFNHLSQAENILSLSDDSGTYEDRTLNNIAGNIYNTKAMIYWKSGELTKALKWHEKALTYRKLLSKKLEVAISLSNIGTVYRDLNEYDKALEYYQRAYEIKATLQNKRSQSRVLFYIIHSALISQNLDIVEKYFPKLDALSHESNEFIQLNCKMGNALILKNHKRLRQKMEAEKIFSDIVNSEMINPHLTLLAMKHLCEIYLDEYKLYDEPKVFDIVVDLVDRMKRVSENIGMFSNLIVALVLQSKLHLLTGHLDKASELLDEAATISEEKKLIKLIQEVKNEKEVLESTFTDWKDKVQSNEDLHQRMKKIEIMKYLNYAQQISQIKFNE